MNFGISEIIFEDILKTALANSSTNSFEVSLVIAFTFADSSSNSDFHSITDILRNFGNYQKNM